MKCRIMGPNLCCLRPPVTDEENIIASYPASSSLIRDTRRRTNDNYGHGGVVVVEVESTCMMTLGDYLTINHPIDVDSDHCSSSIKASSGEMKQLPSGKSRVFPSSPVFYTPRLCFSPENKQGEDVRSIQLSRNGKKVRFTLPDHDEEFYSPKQTFDWSNLRRPFLACS